MSKSSALAFVQAQAQAHADATRAFATLTLIDSEASGGRGARFCLENLSPVEYERFANELQQLLRDDGAQRRAAVSLNERAHVSVVVIDIDDDSPSEEAALYATAQLRLAFAVHFGVSSAAYVAMRSTPRGAHKYHIYLPGVLHIDKAVLDVAIKLARPSVRVDRQPTEQRHLRMHGTDRREKESGRFEGAGIYRLIGGFDERGAPLPRNFEPPAADGCWHSVRAGEQLVRRLLLDPHNAYPCAVTSVARQLLAASADEQLPPGAPWTFVAAAAGGDDAREIQLLLSAGDGSWFLVSSLLRCGTCNDERTEHRCLARVAPFADGAGDRWATIYRWSLCLGCCQSRDVQTQVTLTLPMDTVPAEVACCAPELACESSSFASNDNLLNLPIEVVYPAGFGAVSDGTQACRVVRRGARRVSPQAALEATTVSALTRQLLTCTPGAPLLADDAIVESCVHLSTDDCTVDASDGAAKTNLLNGLTRTGAWAAPPGAHGIELWATPCGGGKTEAALRRMLELLLPGERLLIIAPRVTLCCQLKERTERTAGAEHSARGRVRSYKEVRPNDVDDLFVLVITLESLPKFRAVPFAGVIVDELCTVVHSLHGKTTNGHRLAILDAFVHAVALARHAILMDRDIAAGERLFVSYVVAHMQHGVRWPRTNLVDATVRAPPVHVRHVTMADPVQRTIELWCNVDQMCAHMQQQLHAGRNIAVFCSTKSEAEGLFEYLAKYFSDATAITGSTDEDVKREFGLKPDEHFEVHRTRVWVYTTAAGVGLSVDKLHFHEVYVIAADFLSLRTLLQAEARVRVLVGQSRTERRIHLCLPPLVRDRTAQLLANTMPTVGSVVAAHEYALRHTRAVDTALADDAVPLANESPQLIVPRGAVDVDAAQLYQPTALLLLTLAAMESFERQMTRVFFEHWCIDANITVIKHAPIAEPLRHLHVVAVRAARRVGNKKRDAKRAHTVALDAAAPLRRKRHWRTDELFEPAASLALPKARAFAAWTEKAASIHVRVWLASLVCDAPLLSQALLASQRRAGGAVAAIAPLTGIALLGKLALQFLGLSGVLRAEPAPAEAQWRIDSNCGSAVSPRDGRTLLTVDQFFEHVARHGLMGGRNRSVEALLPSVTSFADHFRNLSSRSRAAVTFDTERKRVALLAKIVRSCYGDARQPHRYIWSFAHWFAAQSDLVVIKQRLFDAPTLALIENTAALASPWGVGEQVSSD
jgi:hypothetical protein